MSNRAFFFLNRFNLFKKCILILLPSSVIVSATFIEPSRSQEAKASGTSKVFVIKSLSSDNRLTLKVYKADINPVEIIDLSGIDITVEGKLSLTGSYYGDKIPNFKLKLLKQGEASVKSGSAASEDEIKAQEQAKSSKIGKWVETPPQKNDELDWGNILKVGMLGAFSLVSLFGLKSTIDLLIKVLNSHHIDLIMLGLGSTGKSWIVARLINPDVVKLTLQDIKITNAVNKRAVPKISVGKYEVFPTYVDTAGNQPGSQISVMFPKKNKSIWVIVLSTTDKKGVSFDSQDSEKINHSYLDKQLGYIRFPLEILESSFCKKPEKVIVCIGKFDVFSNDPPDSKNSQSAEATLKNLFEEHIAQIKNTCAKNGVKFETIICSALEKNWGTAQVKHSIEDILYPGKPK